MLIEISLIIEIYEKRINAINIEVKELEEKLKKKRGAFEVLRFKEITSLQDQVLACLNQVKGMDFIIMDLNSQIRKNGFNGVNYGTATDAEGQAEV